MDDRLILMQLNKNEDCLYSDGMCSLKTGVKTHFLQWSECILTFNFDI